MKAFQNNQAIKDECLKKATKDSYSWYKIVTCEELLGLSVELIQIMMAFHPTNVKTDWECDFIRAIPIGADTSLAPVKISLWMLTDDIYGINKYLPESRLKDANKISSRYQSIINGNIITKSEAHNAKIYTICARIAAEYFVYYIGFMEAAYHGLDPTSNGAKCGKEYVTARNNEFLRILSECR